MCTFDTCLQRQFINRQMDRAALDLGDNLSNFISSWENRWSLEEQDLVYAALLFVWPLVDVILLCQSGSEGTFYFPVIFGSPRALHSAGIQHAEGCLLKM